MSDIDTDEMQPREEPDCGTCGDGGIIRRFDFEAGAYVDEGDCPECNPSADELAARALAEPPAPCIDARHLLGDDWCVACAPF